MDGYLLIRYLRLIASYHSGLLHHSLNVARLSLTIARLLKLCPAEQQLLVGGALLHDVGKTMISHQIIDKPGPLTAEEWREIRRHPALGVKMMQSHQELSAMLPFVYYHHEQWDGKGYYGQRGSQSPLPARIIALADAIDAMTAPRPYREPRPPADVAREITAQSGQQFDPHLVQVISGIDLAALLATPVCWDELASTLDVNFLSAVAEAQPTYRTGGSKPQDE